MIASSNIRPFLHFPLPFGLLGLILMWWGWMGQASFQALPGILLWTPVLRTASLKRHALFICLIHYQRKFRQGRKRRGLPMYLVFVCLRFLCLWLVSGACKSIFDAGDRPRCWPSAWRTQECPACTGLELCILHWVLEFCRFISWCLVCFSCPEFSSAKFTLLRGFLNLIWWGYGRGVLQHIDQGICSS